MDERQNLGTAMLDKLRWAGFISIWVSVVVIPLGTQYRTNSPRNWEYLATAARKIEARNPGVKVSGAQMAFGSLFIVPFMSAYCVVIAALVPRSGTVVVREAVRWNRSVGLLAAGAFGGGCLMGAAFGVERCWSSFSWGFDTLGVGYLIAALGLVLGAVSLARGSLAEWAENQEGRKPGKMNFEL